MNCSFTEKVSQLIDGELSTTEQREVERHLLNCSECEQLRADFLNLRSQIAGFEPSLQPAVQNRALKKILTPERQIPARGLGWSFGAPAVAFAALVIVTAMIGWFIYQSSNQVEPEFNAVVQPSPSHVPAATPEPKQSPEATPEPARGAEPATPTKGNDENKPTKAPVKKQPAREPKPGEQFAAIPPPLRSADTETMTALHFEKSETLLRAFRNVRMNEPGARAEVRYERKRAQQLVYQNMILRREADAAGDVQVSSLLESLEPILLDIANLPERPDEDTVRTIRERVERKNIVPLLRVNSTALARALD